MALGVLEGDHREYYPILDEIKCMILKQACLDYFGACMPPKNPPSRAKLYHTTVDGTKISRRMSDEEYETYCSRVEINRIKMKDDCEKFFKSRYFSMLFPDIDPYELMGRIRRSRKQGKRLFPARGRKDRWYM